MNNTIEKQSEEFESLSELARQWERLQGTAIVDDDYPEIRHCYETALKQFLRACAENGREIVVTGSRAKIPKYASIPHISVTSFARALRWHPGGLESWSPSEWAVALAGEVGELCNVIKKINRARDGMQQHAVNVETLRPQLAMEIGDVYIYLDLLARRCDLKLEECIRDTFNRISEREGFPERL